MTEAIELLKLLWPLGAMMLAILAVLIITREKPVPKTKK